MYKTRILRQIFVKCRRNLATDEKFLASKEEIEQENKKTTTRGKVYTDAVLDGSQFYHTDEVQRTTIHDINREIRNNYIAVNSVSQVGFRLSNGTSMFGPVALFPKTALSWMERFFDVKFCLAYFFNENFRLEHTKFFLKVLTPEHITEDSLILFTLLEPKLDLLIIGVGDPKHVFPVRQRLAPFLRKHRLNFEILSTEHACATFNYLNSEHRLVAAALYPPDDIYPTPLEAARLAAQTDPTLDKAVLKGSDVYGLPHTREHVDSLLRLKMLYKERQKKLEQEDKELKKQLGRKDDDEK